MKDEDRRMKEKDKECQRKRFFCRPSALILHPSVFILFYSGSRAMMLTPLCTRSPTLHTISALIGR